MIKKLLLKWLLPKLLAKKSPQRIPRSGKAGESMDCYSIYLGNEAGRPVYMVDSYNQTTEQLTVFSLNENNTYAIQETLSLDDALRHGLSVYHYYGLYELHYTHIYYLTLNILTKYNEIRVRLHIAWDKIIQSLFNKKKKLYTKDSIELLRFMLERQLKGATSLSNSWGGSEVQGIRVFSLMTELHTHRWINHPNSASEKARLQLHLDSLATSGELKKDSDQYFVQGKALKTLEQHEENDRRHKDATRIQRGILLLTFIIALAGAVQAKLVPLPPIVEWPEALSKGISSLLNSLK
jgi:hypothetical protein